MRACSRERATLLLLAALMALLLLDGGLSGSPDPFAAPAPLALGSGQAASGGHCAAPAR